jgi:hypothetical protein
MSGGLALFWHESILVDIKDSGTRFIDAHIRLAPGEPLFHVTFVYGEPRVENLHRMWSLLSTIKASSSLPWLVLGDFNEALWQYEHFSSCLRSETQMAAFRDCVQVCELTDLGFSGLPFTFDNKRAGNNNVRVRLDRAMADNSWRDIFSDSLLSIWSVHALIIVRFNCSWKRKLDLPLKVGVFDTKYSGNVILH